MYGAGRSMEDMLESGKGLPLVLRVSLHSSFHVVWNLIKPKFHHQAECLLVLHRAYDKKHRTQTYNGTCIMTQPINYVHPSLQENLRINFFFLLKPKRKKKERETEKSQPEKEKGLRCC